MLPLQFSRAAAVPEVRLRSTAANPLKGFLEVRPSASEPWGTVCSNGLKRQPTGASNAVVDVVCSQLGFGSFTHHSYFYSQGPHPNASWAGAPSTPALPIYLDYLDCANVTANAPINASQSPPRQQQPFWSLEQCRSQDPHGRSVSPPSYAQPSKCLHSDDSSVECVIPKRSYEWRLANAVEGSTGDMSRGLVLVRPLPTMPWGTISKNSFTANTDVARNNLRLMCEQLGFPNASAPRVPATAGRYGSLPREQLPAGYVPSRLNSTFPANTTASGLTGPNYIGYVSCDVNTDAHIGDCQWTMSNTISFGDADQLAIICDEHEMPAEVRLVNGIHPSNGQISVRFDESSQFYYVPRRVVLGAEVRLDPNVTAATSNVGLLGALCRAAGFAEPLSPALRLVGRHPASSTGGPVGWGYTPFDAACAAGGPCRPPSVFQSYRTYSGAFPSDVLTFPLGVDCYAAETAAGQFKFRLFNKKMNTASLTEGIVQAQLITSRHTTAWGTVYEPNKNNFVFWNAICRSISPSNDDGYASVRRIKDLRGYLDPPDDRFYRSPDTNPLAPVAFEGMDCPQSIIAPPYTFTAASLTSHANRAINISRECRPRSPLVWTVRLSTDALALSCRALNLSYSGPTNSGFSFTAIDGFDTRLEVSYRGTQAMVCTRDVNALRAMCRLAGYSPYFSYMNTTVSTTRFSPPSLADHPYRYPYASDNFQRARSFLYNLRCSDDNATDLSGCEYDHFEVEDCDDNFAIVKCLDAPPSSEWRFRLNNQGVFGGTAGILEVQPAEGLPWGSVAYTSGFRGVQPVDEFQEAEFASRGAYNFDQYYGLPASICRRMGFADAVTAVATSVILPLGALTGPVWFPSLTCDQSHHDINSCYDNKFGSASPYTFQTVVRIDCYPPLMMHLPSWELRTEHVAAPGRDLHRVLARENASMPWGTVGYNLNPLFVPSYYPVAEATCRLAGRSIGDRAVALDDSRAYVGNSSLGVVGIITRCSSDTLSSLLDCMWDRTMYRQSGSF